jgi:uncharacterized spore protein YtfJ
MSNMEQDVRTTVDELLKAISTKNVVSDPIEIGDNVVITITKVGLGFGTMKGEGRNDKGPSGVGQGVGGAAGVSPVAIIVINKSTPGPGGVEVRSLVPPSGIGKAIGDIATSIMAGMKQGKEKKEQEKTM